MTPDLTGRTVALITGCIWLAVVGGWPAAAAAAPPAERPFHMGFTPFPYDFTLEAVETTFELIGGHSDLVAHHFDDGVPWEEAYRGRPYHPNIRWQVDLRVDHMLPGQKVYLAVTPISALRDGLAHYWGESANMELPGPWRRRELDHPKVIRAYLNHCRTMIDLFQPDYLAYGIEVDLLAANAPQAFQKFRTLARRVYRRLKREYPDLPIFLTFTISGREELERRRPYIERVLPYTDLIAVSTYPYLAAGVTRAADMAPDWFSGIHDLAPEKPFAVAETGFIAETLTIESLGITIPGRRRWQKDYARRLLESSRQLDAEFVVWTFAVDYDRVWEQMERDGAPAFLKAWRDTGLWDESLKRRPALRTWERWLRRPRVPVGEALAAVRRVGSRARLGKRPRAETPR